MNIQKQQLLISYLASSSDLYAMCSGILKTSYFDPSIRQSIHFIQEYTEKYKQVPSIEQIKAETNLVVEVKQLNKAEISYAADEISTFCRHKAIEQAILASPKLLEKQDFGKLEDNIKKAISIGLQKDLGVDYFSNIEQRLRETQDTGSAISTGWMELDELLGGGILRQEMLLFGGSSGSGKSVMMSNLAVNFLEKKLNVLYISLELSERVVAKRFDSMITGLGQSEIFKQMTRVAVEIQKSSLEMGKLHIKRMPESITKANDIRSYLKEFEMTHGYIPDLIIIDYLDCMASNRNISVEDVFTKDKFVSEEVRSIGFDFDCVVCSASQLNRGAVNEKETHSHSSIAGGISKIFTVDNFVIIEQTDQMRAKGEYRLKLMKTRSSGGVGKTILLKWNPISLRVSDFNEKDALKLVKSSDKKSAFEIATENTIFNIKPIGGGILDLMKV